VGRICKKKHQATADFIADYDSRAAELAGLIDGSYEQSCGLIFNSSRARMRRANSVAEGINAIFSPHAGIIEALSETVEEANALFKLAVARHEAATQPTEPA
jgi:hypothetical protein